jgi:excisionase family DNA binding protein
MESALQAVRDCLSEQAKAAASEISPLMTLAEAAARLRIHLLTVRSMIKRGELKSRHIGRRHFVYRESVEAIIGSA